jgi:multidrug resistance efflux pump
MKKSVLILSMLFSLFACNQKKEVVAEVQPVAMEPERIVAIGRVEPEVKITAVGSEVNGVIRDIYVRAGDTLKKGQLLVEFAHDYEDAKRQQILAKVSAQQAEISNVKAQLNVSKIKRDNTSTKLERMEKIVAQGAETVQNLDNLKADYEQTLKEVDRLSAALQTAESRLAEIGADSKVAEADIERRKVKAPADGVILTMDLTKGSVGSMEKSLFEFAPLSPLTVLCEVDELWVNKLQLGQQAIIRTQGTDDQLAKGEVVYLSPYLKKKSLFSDDSANMEDRRVREVRIRLTGAANLLINSRVEAVIDLSTKK